MKKPLAKKIRTSISFSPTLHEALKNKVRKLGMTLTDYIEGLASKSVRRN